MVAWQCGGPRGWVAKVAEDGLEVGGRRIPEGTQRRYPGGCGGPAVDDRCGGRGFGDEGGNLSVPEKSAHVDFRYSGGPK